MTREQKYDAVNSCRTLTELSDVIKLFSDKDGMIQGRSKKFSAEQMSHGCLNINDYPITVLTREFGIRQQAMSIHYTRDIILMYSEKNKI
tara:strand:- start:1347 stop:1616 length:270 start_codon:yes stop_codon:yes gene_type:complete